MTVFQHGCAIVVLSPSSCALTGLRCTVYMPKIYSIVSPARM